MATLDEGARCPVCAARVDGRIATLASRALRRCDACRHRFLEIPEPSSVEVIYNDHYAGFREDPVFHRTAGRVLAEHVRPRVTPPARLLDVGCGNGEFLALARDAGYAVEGIDVSTAAKELCARRGISVRVGDVRAVEQFAVDERFDVITFWDVVEHLPDPHSFLLRAHGLLRPGGYVLVKTPRTSVASVRASAAVPRLAGAILQAPSHVQYFDRAGLSALLRRSGFADAEWIAIEEMRSSASGGSLRRRMTRWAVRRARKLAGDGNLLVLARRS
jgi:2-polyprenyl-3-methyl-5-hydroxy-6-metoxy-1,4-benzoquinol methylase